MIYLKYLICFRYMNAYVEKYIPVWDLSRILCFLLD